MAQRSVAQPMASRLTRVVMGRSDTTLGRTAEVGFQLLVLGFAAYFLVLVLSRLYILVIPLGIAMLFTALLRPASKRLRRAGFKPVWATWTTILAFWVVLGAILLVAEQRATADWPRLTDEATKTIGQLQSSLASGPLHLNSKSIDKYATQATDFLNNHRTALTSGALSGAKLIAEGISGTILAFFIGFFLMYDGEGIFHWVVRFFPRRHQDRLTDAGRSAWNALSGYVRGTLIVALFHGVVIGITMLAMAVPLAVPLAVLVAFGSVIPLVGAVVFGGLAVLVTLVTKGWILAVVVVGVLIIENQAEAHLLQPFVVGRAVHLHPLAIAVVLTIGTVFGGLWGALFAVPFSAAVWAAYVAVARGEDPSATGQPMTQPDG